MIDSLTDEYFEARKADIKERVSEYRFTHVCGVSDTAVKLAQAYGVDVAKARLAGILHDWDKDYDDPGIRQRAIDLGMDIDPFVSQKLARVLHAHTAPVALAREFPEIPADVLQAIDRHTIAAIDMTPLDMVVFCADALEPGRESSQAKMLRGKIGEYELEDLFLEVLAFWIQAMIERKLVIHPETLTIWNHHAAAWRQRKGKQEWKKM